MSVPLSHTDNTRVALLTACLARIVRIVQTAIRVSLNPLGLSRLNLSFLSVRRGGHDLCGRKIVARWRLRELGVAHVHSEQEVRSRGGKMQVPAVDRQWMVGGSHTSQMLI